MIIMPSLLLAVLGIWLAIYRSRRAGVVAWMLSIIFMLGAMWFHMDDSLSISL